jgi:hypothetical protein
MRKNYIWVSESEMSLHSRWNLDKKDLAGSQWKGNDYYARKDQCKQVA